MDREEIVDFVFEQVPLQDTADVKANVNEIVHRAQEFSLASLSFGVITLLWSGTGIFAAVRRGLNAASHRTTPRPYWRAKLLGEPRLLTVAQLAEVEAQFAAYGQRQGQAQQ